MSKAITLLLIENDKLERRALLAMVRKKGLRWDVKVAETLAAARAHLSDLHLDVILAVNRLPDGEFSEFAGEIVDTPLVLITATLEEQWALRRLQPAADEYVVKDEERRYLEALPSAVEKALRAHQLFESEQLMRATFENATSGIFQADHEDSLVAVNEHLCRMLGWPREELLGSRVRDLICPEDRGRTDELNAQLHDGRLTSFQYEARFLKRDASPFWMHVGVTGVCDKVGRYRYCVGTVVDVNARKTAEEQVCLQVAAMEAAPNAISVSQTDPEGTIVWVNPAFTKLTGYSAEEAIGHSHHILSSGLQDDPFYENLWDTIKRGDVWRGELVNRRKDGTLYYEEMGIRQLRDEHGNPTHYVAIKQDISARKEAERKLRESDEALRRRANVDEAIMAAMGEGLFTVDASGLVTYVNAAAERLLGFSQAELMGRTMHEMTHYQHSDGTPYPIEECAILQVLRRGTAISNQEDVFIRKGGELFPVIFSSAPIHLEGRTIGLVVVFRDVTAKKRAEEALRESQQRFAAFMDHLPGAAWIKDAHGRYVYANPEASRIFSKSVAELLGKTDKEIFPPKTARAFRGNDRLAVQKGSVQTTELLHQADGIEHHSIVHKFAVPGADDAAVCVGGVAFDITEQMRAKEALRGTQSQLRQITETMDAGVTRCNRDLRYVWVSPAYANWLGRAPEEIAGRPIVEIVGARGYEQIVPYIERVLNGEQVKYEAEVDFLGQGRRWIVAQYTPTRDAQGVVDGWVAVVTDITSRKHAEQALAELSAESERRRRLYETVLSNTPDLVYVFDLNHRFAYANDALLRMWGRTWEEAIGKNCLELGYEPWHAEMHDREIEQVIATRQPIKGEVPFSGAHGRRIYEYIFVPVVGAGGRVEAVAGTTRDVTERRRAEEAVAAAKLSAEQANKAKDRFMAVLSHELRTPLTPVVTALSMLERNKKLSRDVGETLAMVRRNVELEARLIDDLLDVTRIARGTIELDQKPVVLGEVIRLAVEVCKAEIEARQLRVRMDPGPEAPYTVQGDAARLQQVFWNLVKNAVKFTPEGGEIDIRCLLEGSMVVAEIEDSGIGIEPEELGRIFNAFDQAERSMARQFGGLGLGLSIAKAIVELHGGSIAADSQGKNKGATFRVRLPARDGKYVATGAREQSRAPAPAHTTRALRILLVEDHEDTAMMMQMALSSEGHQVHVAGDMATALEEAGKAPFDLLLSDLGLPDGTGVELMRELRARDCTIPGVALSGYGQDEDIARSKEAGFAIHLTKPVDPDRLLEAIAALVKSAPGECSTSTSMSSTKSKGRRR